MCKGIKDLFLVIYRNLIHHLHPLSVIFCLLARLEPEPVCTLAR